jgi:hypothetical protein
VAHTSSMKINNSDDLSYKLLSSDSTIMSDFRLTHPNSVPLIELIGFNLSKKSTTDPDVSAHYRVSSSVPADLIFHCNDTRESSKAIDIIPFDWFQSIQEIRHKSIGICPPHSLTSEAVLVCSIQKPDLFTLVPTHYLRTHPSHDSNMMEILEGLSASKTHITTSFPFELRPFLVTQENLSTAMI